MSENDLKNSNQQSKSDLNEPWKNNFRCDEREKTTFAATSVKKPFSLPQAWKNHFFVHKLSDGCPKEVNRLQVKDAWN